MERLVDIQIKTTASTEEIKSFIEKIVTLTNTEALPVTSVAYDILDRKSNS